MRLRIGSRMMGGFLLMSILLIVVGIVAILYLDRLQNSSSRILTENVASLKAAEELEIALLDMKGLTGYYLLDGNPRWLTIFEEKRRNCLHWLQEAQEGAFTVQEKQIVAEIAALLQTYLKYQLQTVAAYDREDRQLAYRLLSQEMLSTFLLIYDKCEEFLAINESLMLGASRRIEDENRTARRIMYGVGGIGLLLGVFLGILLARSVTLPIYELVLKVRGATRGELVEKVDIVNETELDHLNRHVRGLIDKIYDTNRDLEESRRMLLQSEKLAALGQVAAGLAHEIHNPLAAIKMLLFSVRQEVQATPQIEKDFEVMTREIARMERFIQNFLQ
ncbi:MAG: MCP four helix bundle domain-containing protein, partial [Planctomycetaceae bacterium]|nr:MCP four helix bundle domain-containing protein [Planctomycetaceae bacterium]